MTPKEEALRKFRDFKGAIDAPESFKVSVELLEFGTLYFHPSDILEGMKAMEREAMNARAIAKKYRDKYALACGEPVETMKLPWERDRDV